MILKILNMFSTQQGAVKVHDALTESKPWNNGHEAIYTEPGHVIPS